MACLPGDVLVQPWTGSEERGYAGQGAKQLHCKHSAVLLGESHKHNVMDNLVLLKHEIKQWTGLSGYMTPVISD
eukprot:COSAG06_NODE_4705_length_4024_cov_6.148280_2_plen_74_part_00